MYNVYRHIQVDVSVEVLYKDRLLARKTSFLVEKKKRV